MQILKKYQNGIYILKFKIFKFKLDWFTDCGDWFLYLYFGKNYLRFSSAGFLKGKVKEDE